MPSPETNEGYRRMGCRGRLIAVCLGAVIVVVMTFLMNKRADVAMVVRYPNNTQNFTFIRNLANELGYRVQAFPEYDVPLGIEPDLFWHNPPAGFAGVDTAPYTDSLPVNTLAIYPKSASNPKVLRFVEAFVRHQSDTEFHLPRAQKR